MRLRIMMDQSNKAMQDKGVTGSSPEDGGQIVSQAVRSKPLTTKERGKSRVTKEAQMDKLSDGIDKSKLSGKSGVKGCELNTGVHPVELLERARSRSKSPRGKDCNPKSLNDEDATASTESMETKPKQAQKRKAKDELDNNDSGKDPSGPKRKQPKSSKKVENSESPEKLQESSESNQTGESKPKKKYARKNKIHTESSLSLEKESIVKKENKKSQKKKKEILPVENGDLSEGEAEVLAEKARKKPGPKKGLKKRPKEEVDSTNLPQQSDDKSQEISAAKDETLKDAENEADSDTVEYSVNSVANSQPTETQPSNKKVVKIDDIEITELSDLNSSREESAEENDVDHSADKAKPVLPTFISLDECEQPDKSFLCSYPNCKYRGKTRVAFRKHLSHHQIYLCAHCEYHCNVYSELESHMVANHPQRWGRKKCKKCQRYIKGDAFDGHEDKCDGTMQFPCEQCEKVFKYESKLHEHEKKFHAHLKCEHCEFVADNKLVLNKHVSATHPKPKKPKTKKAAKSLKPETESKAVHLEHTDVCVEQTEVSSQTPVCPSQTQKNSQTAITSPVQLNSQVEVKSESGINTPTQKLVTTQAGKGTVDSSSPIGAALLSPLDGTPEKSLSAPITKLPVDAPVKDNVLSIDSSVENTVVPIDSSVKDAVLPGITSIPVPFVEKDNIQVTSDSSGQVTLSIPETGTTKSLMSPDSTTPMLFPPDTRNADNVHMCDAEGCGQVFKTYRLLLNHKKNVHNILPSQQMHPCEHPDCSLVFKKKGQLKKHQVVHTGERKYVCSYEGCGKAFRHNANLKIHNLLHTGEKPIKCRFCDFACRQKSSLIHHMKTKHKEIGWPIKGDVPAEVAKVSERDGKTSEENMTGTKTDLESEQVSDADLSFVSNKSDKEAKQETLLPASKESSKLESALSQDQEKSMAIIPPPRTNTEIAQSESCEPKMENASTMNCEPKVGSMSSLNVPMFNAPITLSTPTKAMVKAMAPGFLYAAGASKPQSPAASFSLTTPKTDVYDFDEDDESELNKPTKSVVKKSPGKTRAEVKPGEVIEEAATQAKKKRGPRKKKDESPSAAKPESPKGKKTTPKKKKGQVEQKPEDVAKQPDVVVPPNDFTAVAVPSSDSELPPNDFGASHNGMAVPPSDLDIPARDLDIPGNDLTLAQDDMDIPSDEAKPLLEIDEPKPEIEPEGDSLVEEHVSENPPPLSATSSESAPVCEEPEHAAFDDNMGPPHAPAPAYTHHDHSPLSGMEEDMTHAEDLTRGTMNSPVRAAEDEAVVNRDQMRKSPFSEISTVSQEPVLSNDTSRALSSVASMQSPLKEPSSLDQTTPLDMHVPIHREHNASFDMTPDALSPHKKVNSSFEIPNDIDPDEAAKILEESDEREKNLRNEKGHIREVAGEFVPVLHEVKDGYKYISSPPRSLSTKAFPEDLHLSHGTERGDVGETPPYEFPNYRQHHPEFSHIQGIESQAKDPAGPGVYTEPSQRRPSSSYVPDFLPTLGTTSAGPPSVSSNYSTHSNPVSQNQTDLSTYGASSAAGLPSYPPPSSSVPSYMPPSSVTSYPSTTPVTSTSYSDAHSERATSVGNTRPDPYRLTESNTATTTTSSTLHPGSYPSRDIFPHYFQDPSLPLPPVGSQQDPRSLTYPPQQSSLQALQRSSADFLQRASASGLPGMNYPSVTESLARLSQTTSQQPWISHDERSRPWAQASPILMPPEIDTATSLNRNPFSATRPELSGLEAASKRPESTFPGVPQTVPSTSDRYDAYMGSGHFNPAATPASYSKSLTSNPQKQLEEVYRQSAAAMNDYRSLSHAPPSVTDMYSRMGMNPALGLDKYYPYSREAMYRSQQLGSNPFMPQTSTAAQVPYAERDYARNPYAQDPAYGKYLPTSNLTQPLPPALQGAGDYFQPRAAPPDPYIPDPYRRSVIHNMMSRFYN